MTLPNPIYQLFGRSPIRPIQEHMDQVTKCADLLLVFFEHAVNNDWQAAEITQSEVVAYEKAADKIKLQIRQNLPSGFLLPVARVDLLQMLSCQDKIANKAKDISGLALGRQLFIPQAIVSIHKHLLQRSIDTIHQAHLAINELDSLLETGFSGKEAKYVEEQITLLDDMEHETDEIQIEVRRKLYAIEDEYSPINVIFLYKIIEWTGDLADKAQSVGAQLQVMLAR